MSPHSLRVLIVGGGFPHSEIHGSKPVRGSPWLIAAYHVFHRLSVPRHPPNALTTLDRSHDRCPPSAEVAQCWCAMGHRRNKTSLLHDLTRAGGQAQPLGRRYGHAGSPLQDNPMTKPVKSPLHDVGQPAAAPDGAAANSVFTCGRHPGGARRDRTDDLMLAKHALSQLSYGPFRSIDKASTPVATLPAMTCVIACRVVGPSLARWPRHGGPGKT